MTTPTTYKTARLAHRATADGVSYPFLGPITAKAAEARAQGVPDEQNASLIEMRARLAAWHAAVGNLIGFASIPA